MGESQPWHLSRVFSFPCISPPSFPLPFEVPLSPDLFFSYITGLKMALFKSIRHILRSEQGHVALLSIQAPPPPHLLQPCLISVFKAEHIGMPVLWGPA